MTFRANQFERYLVQFICSNNEAHIQREAEKYQWRYTLQGIMIGFVLGCVVMIPPLISNCSFLIKFANDPPPLVPMFPIPNLVSILTHSILNPLTCWIGVIEWFLYGSEKKNNRIKMASPVTLKEFLAGINQELLLKMIPESQHNRLIDLSRGFVSDKINKTHTVFFVDGSRCTLRSEN